MHRQLVTHGWLRIGAVAFLPALIVVTLYLFRLQAFYLFSAYGLVAVGRILYQMYAAHRVLKHVPRARRSHSKATIVLPVYNEDTSAFQAALESLVKQDYPDFEVIVADDGSDDQDDIGRVTSMYPITWLPLQHGGKREAMYTAFQYASPESRYILTADSDTVWDQTAATELIAALEDDPRQGSVTGYVAALNYKVNLMTKLIGLRYWMAFNQERASQGLTGTVTCVSGPLGAYHRYVIEEVSESFRNQVFLGKTCTYGDDRHLTNLVLGMGCRVGYAPRARCETNVPDSLRTYVKQQARWGRSYWRELIWTFKAMPYQSYNLAYEGLTSLLLPLLLLATIGRYIVLAAMHMQPLYLMLIPALMLTMSVVRTAEPLRRTKDPNFLLFVVYTSLHMFVLLPLRFYSLATIATSRWGSRGADYGQQWNEVDELLAMLREGPYDASSTKQSATGAHV